MATRPGARGYPAGVGWVVGFLAGFVVGMLAWLASGEVTIGLLIFAAAGTALGVAFEQSLDTRPLTEREQRITWYLLFTGVVLGVLALLYVVGSGV